MTYDYKCEDCGEFTVDRTISEGPLEKCPTCGKPVQRIYKPISPIWKCGGAFGKSR